MNCLTCGILYQDNVPHPPSACAEHAGAELSKTKKALDGALDQISRMAREREEIFSPRELNLAIDSIGKNFARLSALKDGSQKLTVADKEKLSKDMEELRLLHLRLVKWKRVL